MKTLPVHVYTDNMAVLSDEARQILVGFAELTDEAAFLELQRRVMEVTHEGQATTSRLLAIRIFLNALANELADPAVDRAVVLRATKHIAELLGFHVLHMHKSATMEKTEGNA